MQKKLLALAPLLFFYSLSDNASEFSLGLQGGSYGTAYNTRHADYWALPYIGYLDGNVYIDGTEAGYYFINTDTVILRSKFYYYTYQYSSPAGRTSAMRSLNSRHSSMMAGLNWQYVTSVGSISTTLAGDTLNNSKGLTANAAFIVMQQWGNFTLVPEMGMDWSNAQNTRYYYGISDEESTRSGLQGWTPHESVVPYFQVSMNYTWASQWSMWGAMTGRHYPSTISESPMVNKHGVIELTMGISYMF